MGVDSHFLLQGIFWTQGSNPRPLVGGIFTTEPSRKLHVQIQPLANMCHARREHLHSLLSLGRVWCLWGWATDSAPGFVYFQQSIPTQPPTALPGSALSESLQAVEIHSGWVPLTALPSLQLKASLLLSALLPRASSPPVPLSPQPVPRIMVQPALPDAGSPRMAEVSWSGRVVPPPWLSHIRRGGPSAVTGVHTHGF